jgi:catechol 2,3-dioxygenase-like lactoylglutathione lyase family enzyme
MRADSAQPTFRGVDHLALTVTDVARSRRFYVEVLGFTAVLESEDSVLCVHKGTAFTLGLVRHPQGSAEPFSHLRTGLDHLGLVAADRAELEAWAHRLREYGVGCSEITDETLGHHLNLRDPDGIALELYAPNARYAAARAELRTRPFTDDELRAKAAELLDLDDPANAGAPVRVASA